MIVSISLGSHKIGLLAYFSTFPSLVECVALSRSSVSLIFISFCFLTKQFTTICPTFNLILCWLIKCYRQKGVNLYRVLFSSNLHIDGNTLQWIDGQLYGSNTILIPCDTIKSEVCEKFSTKKYLVKSYKI